MPSSKQYLMNGLLLNSVSLSEIMVFGMLNLVIMFFETNLIESLPMMLAKGSTLTHFIK